MGRGRLKTAAFAALLTLLSTTAAHAATEPDTITWLVTEMPPFFSYNKGQPPTTPQELQRGEIDGLQGLLIAQMPPEVKQVFVEMSLPRFEAMAREGRAVCSMFHLRTPERLQWLYFTHLLPPLESRELHVVVRRDRLARFQRKGAPI
jgi:uncharacterized protein (TIGR02285 family)